MKIKNATRGKVIVCAGYGSDCEPEITKMLRIGEEIEIKSEYTRIVINEGVN